MKLPLLRLSPSHVALALACVFGASWLASAQLGGTDGVTIPYQGRIELDGVPLEGNQSLTFRVFDVATNGAACWSTTETVAVSTGHFGVVLGPVTEGCLFDRALYLEVEIDGVVLGRQRVHGAAIAHTAGPGGDFDVAGTLYAAVAELTSLTTNGLTANGGANALDVNGTATIDTANVGTLDVSGTATVSALDVDGDLDVTGTATWDCPAGTTALGATCITNSQGAAGSYGGALEACHNQGMDLCPLETVLLCDQLNAPGGGDQCGAVTDRAFNAGTPNANLIMTSTPWTDNDEIADESGFANATLFAHSWVNPPFTANNITIGGGSAGHFYCCVPISR